MQLGLLGSDADTLATARAVNRIAAPALTGVSPPPAQRTELSALREPGTAQRQRGGQPFVVQRGIARTGKARGFAQHRFAQFKRPDRDLAHLHRHRQKTIKHNL
mgnify:CR=1 FL=1